MIELYLLIQLLIRVFTWMLLGYCILSMLLGYGVLNIQNRFFYGLYTTLGRLVEPFLNPIRRLLPATGGLDFAPFILLLAIQFLLQPLVRHLLLSHLYR
ncbi:YggT family protein [Neokomagataea tanensis]|uniref:YggT family protein n=1 Tax=Neokomagataea tanensis TaxID=661191 RepID=A0A4Y6V8L9_9PROT|nr:MULTISPECIES: YggT family protein [Neokomagataea]QDH24715.1 YggT family protein [Neokomagataea tanensis]